MTNKSLLTKLIEQAVKLQAQEDNESQIKNEQQSQYYYDNRKNL